MTNDGDLINGMMRARFAHEKEYKVTVQKEITPEFIEKMSRGVHIKDKEKNLDAVTRPCTVKKIGKYTFSIILTQGLNRQIRRMCEALGYKVTNLKLHPDHEHRTWESKTWTGKRINRTGVKGIIWDSQRTRECRNW